MAAPWAAGARAVIVGEIHGQLTNNVIHFATNTQVNDGPDFETLLLQLATALKECVVETLLPGVSSDWTFKRVEAERIFPTVTDPVVATGAPENVGELGAASVSFESSLITIRTGGGGRRGRGRIFLPPAGEGQTANSAIDTPTLLLLVAFCACMAGKFGTEAGTTPWRIGILSRKNLNGSINNFNAAFRTATQLTPGSDVACMRSRRKGHGA